MDTHAPDETAQRGEQTGAQARPSAVDPAAAQGRAGVRNPRSESHAEAGRRPLAVPVEESLDARLPALIARFSIYTLVFISLVLALPVFARGENWSFFAEDGPLEIAQLLVLGAILVLLLAAYRSAPQWAAVFALLAGVFAWCAIRENDRLFDDLLPFGGWQLVATIAWLVLGAFAWRARSTLVPGMRALAFTPGPILLWAGLIMFAPLAQGLGHRPLLELIVPVHEYAYRVTRAIEESTEFFGYLVCLAGVIELLLACRMRRPRARSSFGASG